MTYGTRRRGGAAMAWARVLALAVFAALAADGAARAADYTVDATAQAGDPDYGTTLFESLEALRTAGVGWTSGDTITLTGDDNSLTAGFDFGAASVTIRGHGVVTPGNPGATNVQFARFGDDTNATGLTLVADAGKSLEISGFDSGGLANMGGALRASQQTKLTFGEDGGDGVYRFSGNKAVSGAALNSGGEVNFLSGYFGFTGNTVGATGNESGRGGAVYAGNAGKTLVFDGGTYEFLNNVASDGMTFDQSGLGGAVYSAGALNFRSGDYLFSGNQATSNRGLGAGRGGAVYANAALTFSDGNYVFSKNAATATVDNADSSGQGGAVYADGALTFTAGRYTFAENTAASRGGAVYANSALNFVDGVYSFTGNTAVGAGDASGIGGAVFGATITFSDGNYAFTGNKATGAGNNSGRGGALNAVDALSLRSGSHRFQNNHAEQRGGAVYADRNATLVASGGDVLFRGNTTGADPLAPTGANALFVGNLDGNNTLTLAAETERRILFYDPIASDSTKPGLTVHINSTDGGASYTGGRVVFDGAHWLARGKTTNDTDYLDSALYGDTTVHGGTLELANGVNYQSNGGVFALAADATLLTNAIPDLFGGSVTANTVDLGGATLAFDLTDATATSTNLFFYGNVTGDVGAIDLRALGGDGGGYKLANIANTGAWNVDGASFTLRGEDVANTRAGGMTLEVDGGTLKLANAAPTGIVEWTNASGDGLWNATSENWDTSAIAGHEDDNRFLPGDAVVFGGTGGVVKIQKAGVRVAGHNTVDADGNPFVNPGIVIVAPEDPLPYDEVLVGDWTFTGGELAGGDIRVTSDTTASVRLTFEGLNGTAERAMSQRITVDAPIPDPVNIGSFLPPNITLGLNAASGVTLVWDNLAQGSESLGGVINAGRNMKLGGGSDGTGGFLFRNNAVVGAGSYSGHGGALHIAEGLTFNAGNYAFIGNKADAGPGVDPSAAGCGQGGAVWVNLVSFEAGDYTFADNSVTGNRQSHSGRGGALYSNSGVNFKGGTYTFAYNSATGDQATFSGQGGAVYSNTYIKFSAGDYTFIGNKATGGANNDFGEGGALYAVFGLRLDSGSYRFEDNHAQVRGGAIYVKGGEATLLAKGGDILFRGNTLGADATAPSAANALYMDDETATGVLSLAAEAGRSLLFYDPIVDESSSATFTININSTDGGATSTDGRVVFDGAYWLSKGKTPGKAADKGFFTSKLSGTIKVYGGTLELVNGAAIETSRTMDIHSGATLLTNAASHTNRLGSELTFYNGSTLAFDLDGAVDTGQAGATTNLRVNPASPNPITAYGTVNVDLRGIGALATGGKYNLVDVLTIEDLVIGNHLNLQVHGEDIAGTRAAGAFSLGIGGMGNELLQVTKTADIGNHLLYWAADSGDWNATGLNWRVDDLAGAADEKFFHGDAVVFGATADYTGGGDIVINPGGVTVGYQRSEYPGLTIASGNWTFSGGEIRGGEIHFADDATATFAGVNGGAERAFAQRVTVAGISHGSEKVYATLHAAAGATLAFDGFTDAANPYGGAIAAVNANTVIPELILGGGGAFRFTGNKAVDNGVGLGGGWGGAIYVGVSTFNAGTYTFTGNTATGARGRTGEGGAVFSYGTVYFNAGTHTFTGNVASGVGTQSGRGGAVFASGSFYFETGRYRFIENVAHADGVGGRSGLGGALYGANVNFYAGDYVFTGNRATGMGTDSGLGGAIYAQSLLMEKGAYEFTGNHASGAGGAIHVLSNATLDASSGDIRFAGNTAGTAANAIHLANTNGGGRLHMQTAFGRLLAFFDPVTSDDTRTDLLVLINIASSDYGTVLFDGSHWLAQNKDPVTDAAFFTSTVYGTTTVFNGTIAVRNGAVYENLGTGTFDLNAPATLAGDGTVKAATQTISGTLAPGTDTGGVATLSLDGDITLDGATLAIDIAGATSHDKIAVSGSVALAAGTTKNTVAVNSTAANGVYNILTSGNPMDKDGMAGRFVVAGTGADGYSYARGSHVAVDEATQKILRLTLDTTPNLALTWTGAASAAWDVTSAGAANWTDNPGGAASETRFKNGDAVSFDSTDTAGMRSITLSAAATVAGMSVSGTGDYSFSGAALSGSTAGTTITNPTGTLLKSGSGTLAFNNDVSFVSAAVSGGTLKIGSNGATGSIAGDINITNNAAVVFNRSGDIAYADVISGNGTVTQSGGGALTLSGDSSAYAGTFTQSAGGLHLAATGKLGGGFLQNAGALTSAAGATLGAATFKGTVTPAGKLAVASAVFNGATVDLSGGLDANRIVATGTVGLTGSNTTIKLGDLSAATASASYQLMAGSTISGLDKIDANVTLGHNRGGFYFADGDTKLFYGLIVGNASLYWIGIGGGDWNTTATNTNWTDGNFTTHFKTGDTAFFGDSYAVSKVVSVAAAGVSVAGMIVSGSNYEFSGGSIGGSGTLAVNQSAAFKNQFSFTNGATVAAGVTLTVDTTAADWNLSSVVSGAGSLVKSGGGTLTLSGANTHTGGVKIDGGALAVSADANLGVADGAVTINAGTLSATGAFTTARTITLNNAASAIDVAAGQTLTLSGPLGGSGKLNKTGAGTLANLGGFAGAVAINAGAVKISTATFGNALTGAGVLAVDRSAATDAFAFESSAGSAFAGAVEMRKGTISLDDASNYAVLRNAGLKLGADGSTDITQDRAIKALTMDGGTLRFTVDTIAHDHVLRVTDLYAAGGGTIQADIAALIDTSISTMENWYDYGDAAAARQHLVVSAANVSGDGAQLDWRDSQGNELATKTRAIHDGARAVGTATFGYAGSVDATGIKLGYTLTRISADAGETINLDSAGATGTVLNAKLTGSGGFEFGGSANVSVGNAASDYAGATTITGARTVTMLADNAFGGTSSLSLAGGAKLDMGGKSQSVGALSLASGTEVALGSLTATHGGDVAGALSGGGTLTQAGGTLAYSGTQSSGAFVQTGGALNTANGAKLGEATFKGSVTPTGTLTLASAAFDGAEIDFGALTAGNKLVVSGGVTLSDAGVRIDAAGAATGQYTLAEFASVTLKGINAFSTLNLGDRRGGEYVNAAGTAFMFEVIDGNTTLYWNGTDGNTSWNDDDRTNRNWSTGNTSTYFKTGDTVIFTGAAARRDVDIHAGGVSVAGMTVDGADYTFTGSGGIASASKLVIQNKADATLANTGVNNFAGGAQIASGASLTLGRNDASGSLSGTIANDGVFAIDRSDAYILDNPISGAGTTKMTGSGHLTISGTHSQSNAFEQSAGTVNLAKTWTGAYTQTGGRLTGNGKVDGHVDISGTVAPTGALSLSGATFHGGSVLAIDAPGADKLLVTGATTFDVANGKITVDLGVWLVGTITILESSLSGALDIAGVFADVTLYGRALGGRQAADLSVVDGDLVLTTSGTSAVLAWTGAHGGGWNTTDENWSGGDKRFINGDDVVFGDAAGTSGVRAVTVASGGVHVGSMDVTGPGYSFSGGSITGADSLALNENATFKNQFEFAGGASVADGKTLTVDTAAGGWTLSTAISGAGAVVKTGAGRLTVSGTNTNTGLFTQTAGEVELKSNWAGDYKQAAGAGGFLASNGAVVGGDASFFGVVDPTGALKVDGTATFSGATLKIDTTTSDRLVVGAADFVGANTVDLQTALAGGYTFLTGTVGAFDASSLNTTWQGKALNSRQAAAYEYSNNALTLTISAQNMGVTWRGGDGAWRDDNWDGPHDNTYIDGDAVSFAGKAKGRVNLGGGTVAPASVTLADGADYGLYGGTVNAAGAFAVQAGAKLDLDVTNTKIVADSVSFAGEVTLSGATDRNAVHDGVVTVTGAGQSLDAARMAELFDVGAALWSRSAFFNDAYTVMGIEYSALTLSDFAGGKYGARLSANGLAVAEAYDRAFEAGYAEDVEAWLYGLPTDAEVARAMTELSPAALAGGTALSPLVAARFRNDLDKLWQAKWVDDEALNKTSSASSSASPEAWARPAANPVERGWRFWGATGGAWSEYDSPNGDPGYTAKEWSATVAGYRTFGAAGGDAWSFGGALNFNHSKLDWKKSFGETKGDGIAGALMAMYERGAWFAALDGVWGATEIESRRRLPLAGLRANADYRAHWYGADLTTGYRARLGDWNLRPSAGARWYRYNTPGVSEKGAGAAGLFMGRDHRTGLEFFGRLDVSRTWRLANGVSLTPRGFAGLSVEAADRWATPTMNFAGAPAGLTPFRGYSAKSGRVAGQLGLGLEAKFGECWTVFGEYSGEFRDREQRHSGQVGLGLEF